MKKACMFPGQGVQFTGMMKEEYCNKYSKYIKSADDILGYSIVDICNNKDRAQMLNQTEFTQPAMYMVNAFSYFDYIEREGIPEYCIGHSMKSNRPIFNYIKIMQEHADKVFREILDQLL